MNKIIKHKLIELGNLLKSGGETLYASNLKNSLNDSNDKMWNYLTSNELWGGSGSIADQALIESSDLRKQLQHLLIELGNLQIKENRANIRTQMWVSAFSEREK